ncbi:MAG: helix-turn-helix domain-containing protein [Betaproteobacteria bacterium]|nr:helix-turn-helix domain-containing protein [Betaproteobacteria bacterium]
MGKSAYPMPTRLEYLTGVYGECCRPGVAAKILGVSPGTISAMTRDGRLKTACGGKKVDMHSIAAYMDAPAQADFKARLAKRKGGKLPQFYVL